MMAKRRSLDPELFAHPAYRRADFVQRELWVGLIVNADDEGRLRADPLTLAETIFSPLRHQVTEELIAEALSFWREQGWLLCYNGNCVFLTGWYEHQYIAKDRRDPSALPAPPCAVNSWVVADTIFAWYAAREGARKTHYQTALRAFMQCTDTEQDAILKRTCSEQVLNVAEGKGRELKGTEGKGRGQRRAATAPPDGPADGAGQRPDPPPPGRIADTSGHDTCNCPVVAAAVRYFCAGNPPAKSKPDASRWAVALKGQLALAGCAVTEAAVVASLEGEAGAAPGPAGREASFPDAYLERLAKDAAKSPANQHDPNLPNQQQPMSPELAARLRATVGPKARTAQ
jgi:hypothetical protein